MGRRERQALAPAHEVEPVERRENLEKREQRAVQALAIKGKRVIKVHLAPLVPLALQDLQPSIQLAVTAQLFQESLDPEDHLGHQAPREHLERMESQVILVRTEKLALRDLQASLEPQENLEPEERRETMEKANLAPGDPQDLQGPQDLDSDLPLWTWKVQDSQIWNLFGDCLGHPGLLVPPVYPAPLQVAQQEVLEHLDHQEGMEDLDNLACLVYQVLTASQELPVPREKRVIQVSWVFQE